MIVTKTPFRISFIGGGSDLRSYYKEEGFGAVISSSINKYMYVVVNQSFDSKIRMMYSKYEICNSASEVENPIAKFALSRLNISNGVDIASLADIPKGTGLGSSSSYSVGLVNALSAFNGNKLATESIAQIACEIEITDMASPIGKQDQYCAAYGGLNYIQFNADETVCVTPIILSENNLSELNSRLLLFYTGIDREASSVLAHLQESMLRTSKRDMVKRLVDLTVILKQDLLSSNIDNIGELMNEGWRIKRELARNISNDLIDDAYQTAISSGATGGKLLGAGNGGFLLVLAEKKHHKKILENLWALRNVDIALSLNGTMVINHD
jgi:D-glycero-alpha-D-manno-heptose-7-phosphate kinase